MPRNIIGSPAFGGDFFDREGELRRIWRDLEAGHHLLLLSPRRVGKTSLLYRLRDYAWKEGWGATYVTVAEAKSEADFIQLLVRAVLERDENGAIRKALTAGPLKKTFAVLLTHLDEVSLGDFGVKLRAPGMPGWRELLVALEQALPQVRQRWIIALDEFPIFVQALVHSDGNSDRARDFLTSFRELRQGNADQGDRAIRWILAGSIGLDSVARRHRLVATINDLKVFPLGEFSREKADEFVEVMGVCEDLALDEATRQRILERAEWLIPYHLKLLVSALWDQCAQTGREPSPALVDQAFEALLGPDYRLYFDHWSARLEEDLGPAEAERARALLSVAAKDPTGASKNALAAALQPRLGESDDPEEVLLTLLDLLERDGYLVPVEGRWRFRSPLLRGYWVRRFLQ